MDAYKLGVSLNAKIGVRNLASDWITPKLQLYGRTARRDTGQHADAEIAVEYWYLRARAPRCRKPKNAVIRLCSDTDLPAGQRLSARPAVYRIARRALFFLARNLAGLLCRSCCRGIFLL